MTDNRQPARILFALGMVSLGILALVYGANAQVWYSVPAWVPWRTGVTWASGIIMLAGGVGLLFNGTARLYARVLFPYLVIWLLMRVPSLATGPLVAVNWENAGELAVLVAGAWILFARLADLGAGSKLQFAAGANAVRTARILFALSLVAFGISHFAYARQTAGLVPSWLPLRMGWVYLTGAAHAAAGIGVLLSIYPRLAATMEAAMLGAFTVLVWVPAIIAAPQSLETWTELLISMAVTAGAWVVAESMTQPLTVKKA